MNFIFFPCNPKNVLSLCIMCDEIYLEILASVAYTSASALAFLFREEMKIEDLRRHKLKLVVVVLVVVVVGWTAYRF